MLERFPGGFRRSSFPKDHRTGAPPVETRLSRAAQSNMASAHVAGNGEREIGVALRKTRGSEKQARSTLKVYVV